MTGDPFRESENRRKLACHLEAEPEYTWSFEDDNGNLLSLILPNHLQTLLSVGWGETGEQPRPYRGGCWEVSAIGETGLTSAGKCGSGMGLKGVTLSPLHT